MSSGTHSAKVKSSSGKDSMMLWNQLIGKNSLHQPDRDATNTLLFHFPVDVRHRILEFVGFESATELACVNREHSDLLDNESSKMLVMQRWKLGSSVVQSIDGEQKMSWFDFGVIILSLVHQITCDLFRGHRMPVLLEQIWVEAKLNDFFCHETSIIQTLGIDWDILSSESNFSRTLQNALNPDSVHEDNDFNAPDFSDEVIFFGHWGTGSSAVFLGLWVSDLEEEEYEAEDYKTDRLSWCPVVEWNYTSNKMILTYVSFYDFVARGCRVQSVNANREYPEDLKHFLYERNDEHFFEELQTTMAKSSRDYNADLRHMFPSHEWTQKIQAVLEHAHR